MYLNKEAKQFLKGKTRTSDHKVGTAKPKNIEQPISPIGTSNEGKFGLHFHVHKPYF